MRQSIRTCVLVALVALWPHAVEAQAFLASLPNPDLKIGSLFVHAHVLSPGRVTVDVFFRILHGATDSPQDLYLLWPGELFADKQSLPDQGLVRFVESLGMTTIDAGRVRLASAAPDQYPPVPNPGGASFVTVITREPYGVSPPGTLIRLPWNPRDILVLSMKVRSVIQPRTASWLEGLYSGWRYTASLSFHDLRVTALRPIYLGRRAYVVPLADDDSHRLQISFSDADRLSIDQITPPSALSRLNTELENTQSISLFLNRDPVPTTLQANFAYSEFLRTVIVTVGVFLLAQVFSPWLLSITKRSWHFLRPGLGLRRDRVGSRTSGVLLGPRVLDRVAAGEITYEELVRLWPPSEERTQPLTPDRRLLVYRGRRWVPRWTLMFGQLRAATGWSLEDVEVEITFEHGRVAEAQTLVRRARFLP